MTEVELTTSQGQRVKTVNVPDYLPELVVWCGRYFLLKMNGVYRECSSYVVMSR